MAKKWSARQIILISVLSFMALMIAIASAGGPGQIGNPSNHGSSAPVENHIQKESVTPIQTMATPVVPVATQTTVAPSSFSDPSVIAAGIGLASAGIGAGATLYT
ncbi:MAG: hypothetical protein WCC86_02645, partial [Methanoregula sp.]